MFRERPLGHLVHGEETGDSFGIHNEGSHSVVRIRVHLEVRNVRADPGAAVPSNLFALRVPRLAVGSTGSPVVLDASVGGPRPCPVERLAIPEGIGVVPAGHQVPGLGPAAGVYPAAAGCCAVVPELREAVELFARFADNFCFVFGVYKIGQGLA